MTDSECPMGIETDSVDWVAQLTINNVVQNCHGCQVDEKPRLQ
jgi:hypothetical protein